MTYRNRRQWAKAFMGFRHHGFRRVSLLIFAAECARRTGSWAPLLVALRVVWRAHPKPGRSARGLGTPWPELRMWPPRALGVLAAVVALVGISSLRPAPIRIDPPPEWPMPERGLETEWLARDGAAGIAVPMPTKRMDRQQAPPCIPPPARQADINGACWYEMVGAPPCGMLYEHEGKCYAPVPEAPRPPTSVDL